MDRIHVRLTPQFDSILAVKITILHDMEKQLWVMDPVHSEVMFKVRHMMITTVTGTFETSTGKMLSSASDFSDAEISFEAEVNSISTRNTQRDEHLRSQDFFEAAKYPKITFKSSKITFHPSLHFDLEGEISMHGITKSILLKGEYTGSVLDPWGMVRAGFELSGSVNRYDFGLTWNANTEDGGIVLSEEVKLIVNVEMIKQVG